MNKLTLVGMSRAAALVVVVGLPSIVAAATADACHVPGATPLDERVEQESLQGMQSFGRFIHRTRNVYQLDLRTEVAKMDARKAAERECLAQRTQSATTAAVEESAPVQGPVATSR